MNGEIHYPGIGKMSMDQFTLHGLLDCAFAQYMGSAK